MKTIMIVVGGMADTVSSAISCPTPLKEAYTPALDALAKCGCVGSIGSVGENVSPAPETFLLSLLGYDFDRGVPDAGVLQAYGLGDNRVSDALRYYVIPKFSGHGVVVTDNALARGIGMMALLRPVFTIDGATGQQKDNPCGTLTDKANVAIRAIDNFDFVLVYVDGPREAALRGDYDAKVAAIEEIDSKLINPVADYVWNAKIQMNLVVVSGGITAWESRCDVTGDIPAVVYFNDDLPYETDKFDEKSVEDGPLNAPLPGDLMRLLISFEPTPEK